MAGAANLRKQIENVKAHGVTPVVAINAFPTDHDSEHDAIREIAEQMGARVAVCTHFSDGGAGATDARRGRDRGLRGATASSTTSTRTTSSLKSKIETVATTIYGAERVEYTPAASKQLAQLRGQRLRQPAGVHRQDPPVDLGRRRRSRERRRVTR